MDVFIAKSSSAIHLGTAEVHLRDLWERETAMQEATGKSPVVQQSVRVMALRPTATGETTTVAVGKVTIKMRMRRPLQEASRFMRQKNEIDNLKSTVGVI